MENKNSFLGFDLSQEKFFKLSKSDRMISFFKTSRKNLEKSVTLIDDDLKSVTNFNLKK